VRKHCITVEKKSVVAPVHFLGYMPQSLTLDQGVYKIDVDNNDVWSFVCPNM